MKKCIKTLRTAQKLKFSIKYFASKCDQIRGKLRTWSHLLEKSLMENFIFYAVTLPVSSKLSEQIVSLKRQCWSNCQYSKRTSLEISGLSKSKEHSELEDTTLKLFKKTGCRDC